MRRHTIVLTLMAALACSAAATAAEPARADHPYLLWTGKDSRAIRRTIERQPDELSSDQRAGIERRRLRYIQYAIRPGGTYDTTIYNNEKNYARYDGEQGRVVCYNLRKEPL